MEVPNNEQENKDNCNGGVDKDDESRRDRGNKRLKLDELLDAGNGSENVEGDLPVSKAGQFVRKPSASQEIPLLAAREEKRGERGQAEAVRFEFHFPEEVWLLILDMVENADRVNCCRALPYLDRILTESKPVFMSEQVLPLMDKWLSNNELLTCRQVCKTWCGGVNELMFSKRASQLHYCWYKFSDKHEVDRFIRKFSGHTRSPFIDGTVRINRKWGWGLDREYPEKVLQLLRQFGKHIKILLIRNFCEALDPLEWYRFLQEALKNTPNLIQLGIIGQDLVEQQVEEEDILELHSYMAENPLPFIPTLDVLDLNMEGSGYGTIQDIQNMLMFPYATQLKALSMLMPNWKDHFATGLVKLSRFYVFDLKSDANLERLLDLTAPLKLLTLQFTGRLSIIVLLRVLQNFPSLEDLSINFQRANDVLWNEENISNWSHLNVPAVKSLEITSAKVLSYNFLQMFTGLRRLIVEVDSFIFRGDSMKDIKQRASREGEKNLQLFKIFLYGDIYDSNMWKLIPTLNYAEMRIFDPKQDYGPYSGTREGYNEYLSSSN